MEKSSAATLRRASVEGKLLKAVNSVGGCCGFDRLRSLVNGSIAPEVITPSMTLLMEAGLVTVLTDGRGGLFYATEAFLEKRR